MSREHVYSTIKKLQEAGHLGRIDHESGNNYVFSCPFTQNHGGRTQQRTPSFGIEIDNGKWNCFSCGAGGQSVNSLYAKLSQVSQETADYVLGTPTTSPDILQELLDTLKSAQEPVELMTPYPETVSLKKSILGASYLQNRGIPEWVQEAAGLCFYPKDKMPPLFGEDYSAWPGNRIVFPIAQQGKIIGYSARSVKDDGFAKYYRPVSGIGQVVYCPVEIKSYDFVCVAEGELSVLACIREGLPCVGLFGSNMSREHAEFLSRFKTVVLLLDNDDAGKKGVTKALTEYASWVNFRVMWLPAGKDPADMQSGWGKHVLLNLQKPMGGVGKIDQLEQMLAGIL